MGISGGARLVGRVAGAVPALLLLAACAAPASAPVSDPVEAGRDQPSTMPTSSTTQSPASPAPGSEEPSRPPGTRLVVDESEFGAMLYAADGQAIYLFDLEGGAQPRCYDECAAAWPPVLTDGDPVAGRGMEAGLIGTVERRDGARQVTYGGHPLYFYAHEDPWQVLCHDFTDFGGTWFVVQPDGRAAP